MDPLGRLVKLLLPSREDPDEIHECRNCGTLVPPSEQACPNCESTNVAEYDL